MKQTLKFARQRCERYVVIKVYTYSYDALRGRSCKRVGAGIFS